MKLGKVSIDGTIYEVPVQVASLVMNLQTDIELLENREADLYDENLSADIDLECSFCRKIDHLDIYPDFEIYKNEKGDILQICHNCLKRQRVRPL